MNSNKNSQDVSRMRLQELFRERTPEEKVERKAFNARIGHVKRRLNKGESLNGDLLKFALSQIGIEKPEEEKCKDPFFQGIADKILKGVPLSEYEHHIFVDVVLLHSSLGRP